jgi:hypothetical protein
MKSVCIFSFSHYLFMVLNRKTFPLNFGIFRHDAEICLHCRKIGFHHEKLIYHSRGYFEYCSCFYENVKKLTLGTAKFDTEAGEDGL